MKTEPCPSCIADQEAREKETRDERRKENEEKEREKKELAERQSEKDKATISKKPKTIGGKKNRLEVVPLY